MVQLQWKLRLILRGLLFISVGSYKFKTKVINNTVDPVWNAVYEVRETAYRECLYR